jgi:thymidylate kinase
MLNTKLILVEGFPGAGKSTTTGYLQTILQRQGFECRQFLEDDVPHPIACLGFEIKGRPAKVVPLWEDFIERAQRESAVTIIESRLWQNTTMFRCMSECDVEENQ